MHGPRYDRQAFTLIELLVVMAVIVLFVGGLGLALSGGDGSVATAAGQRTLTTMISAARSQAVVNQNRARLIIHIDPPPANQAGDPRTDKFLRFMAIVVRRNGVWEPINDGTYLPRGVYVVPPAQFDPGPTLPTDLIPAGNGDWNQDRRTIMELATMEFNFEDPASGGNLEHYLYIEFAPRGTTRPTTEIGGQERERRIVVAPARAAPDYPRFDIGGDVGALGGMVRRNGSFTLVHNPEGFPKFISP